jgi:diguanylate cyclase (GGDEF)-like protein
MLDARRAAWDHARSIGATLAQAAASDIARNIESLDLSLKGASENLKIPGLEAALPEHRQLILFDRSALAQHLSSILIVGADGNVRYDSRTVNPSDANLADRDYFKIHRYDDNVGLYIDRPINSRTTFIPVVCFSRRLSNPDGSFAGVVVGAMRLDYFGNLFKSISLGPHADVTLARSDGIVMMRSPENSIFIERSARPTAIIDQMQVKPSGAFESPIRADGEPGLFTYHRIGEFPLVVAIGQSAEDIYAQWWPQAGAVGALMTALVLSMLTLVAFLKHSMKLRHLAQAELATLATSDGLTGLANRRAFDAALEMQWRSARRSASAPALLMIDADHFKVYNDSFGHQAGDELLKHLARAIADNLRRPGDLGARYGGDEFAVLLPDCSLDDAVRIARQIRQAFGTLCDGAGIDAAHARLSIGVASRAPARDDDCGILLTAADEALYRAKTNGRNRIEPIMEEQQAAPLARVSIAD